MGNALSICLLPRRPNRLVVLLHRLPMLPPAHVLLSPLRRVMRQVRVAVVAEVAGHGRSRRLDTSKRRLWPSAPLLGKRIRKQVSVRHKERAHHAPANRLRSWFRAETVGSEAEAAAAERSFEGPRSLKAFSTSRPSRSSLPGLGAFLVLSQRGRSSRHR
eukprot:scaffold831_cov268-Pinguiococcus_pyrenoidosus.AAC.3